MFRSSDGGVSFPLSKCIAVGVAGDVDKTALAVDGGGHVFAAVEDALSAGVRVWRSGATWDALTENPVECAVGSFPECTHPAIPRFFLYGDEPRMGVDPNGDVWLMTVNTGIPSELGVIGWDASGDVVNFIDLLHTQCAPVALPAMVAGSGINVSIGTTSATPIRNAFRYSFGFGYTNLSQVPALRVAYEHNDVLGNRQIQVVELSADYPTPAICGAPPGWNTAFPAGGIPNLSQRNFMSAISYKNKGIINQTEMEWQLGYMYGSGPGLADPTKQYAGIALHGLLQTASSAQMLWRYSAPLTPSDYFTCPSAATGYWGDYFGVAQIWDGSTWRALATFTDSRPAPPCQPTGPSIGMPMQVASGLTPP